MRGHLTHPREGATARLMHRLLSVLVGAALLLSLAAGGMAHAAEQLCLPGVEAMADGHTDGDADQAPHGNDGYAHHHGGCSGHHNLAPFEAPTIGFTPARAADVTEFESKLWPSAPPSGNLRPPIA